MNTPTIETTRLLLRPMTISDVDALLVIFADPLVMAAFHTAPFDRVQMTQWVQRNLEHQAQHGYGLFTVVLKESGLVLGDCGLEQMEYANTGVAELGYDVRSDHWNRGYATEAASAVRDFAFAQLRLPRLVSFVRQHNLPSQRVAEKIGMQRSDELVRYDTSYFVYATAQPALLSSSPS